MSGLHPFRKPRRRVLGNGGQNYKGNGEVPGAIGTLSGLPATSSLQSYARQNIGHCVMKDQGGVAGGGSRVVEHKVGGGHEGGKHFASYIAATDLLRTISERRKVFDKGASVAKEMQEHVYNIAEAEDARKYRTILPNISDMEEFGTDGGEMMEGRGARKWRSGANIGGTKAGREGYASVKPNIGEAREGSSGDSYELRGGNTSSGDEPGESPGGESPENAPEDEAGFSSLLLSEGVVSPSGGTGDDASDGVRPLPSQLVNAKRKIMSGGCNGEPISVSKRSEEEAIDLQVSLKQERVIQLRSFQRAIVDIEDRFDEERASREALQAAGHNATSEEYEQKMKIKADHMKRIMRENFESLFDDAEDLYTPPEPSPAFSIENMAQTLGLLGKSLATIVEATDEICTSSTFKTEGEPVSIYLCTKALRVITPYAKMLLELAVSHLSHFESGEKGILEGAVEEVNRLRETFLQSKDQLIIEEQNLKTALEHRQSLLKRVRGTHDRCDMWEKVLFCREPAPHRLEELEATIGAPESMGITQSLQSAESGLRPFSSGGSATRSSSCASITAQEKPILRPSEVFTQERKVSRKNSKGAHPSGSENDAVEDIYEAHVAKSWGNPYVHKAKQYEKACVNAAIARRLSQLHNPVLQSPIPSQQFLGASLPASPAGVSFNIFDVSQTSYTSSMGQSLPLGSRSIGGMTGNSDDVEYGVEITQNMLARRLQLLQGLFRTIPAAIFSADFHTTEKRALGRPLSSKKSMFGRSTTVRENKDVENNDNTNKLPLSLSEKTTSGNTIDANEQLRVETRQSIQRLIRYTTQELKKYGGLKM